jgi:chromosome segregation ATPase
MSSREMQQDIKRTINAIEKQIENCNDKIEDASDEFNDYNAQLRSLLTRRENASPSECLVLDGQIDELNSKRSSVMSKIKQYRQIKANLSDRLNLLEKLGTQQDITSMTASISEITGGRLGDIEGIAMYLKDSIAQGNEALENIGMAVAVSESEDINMGSLSATYAGLTDNTNVSVKDDHKYDNLMMDLGMPV